MKTTKEMIAIMQAHADEEAIPRQVLGGGIWTNVSSDSTAWDWCYFDYRLKPAEPNYADCRCGGKAAFGVARYAIGYIYCDSCGIRTKERHCDAGGYSKDRRNDWNSIMREVK